LQVLFAAGTEAGLQVAARELDARRLQGSSGAAKIGQRVGRMYCQCIIPYFSLFGGIKNG